MRKVDRWLATYCHSWFEPSVLPITASSAEQPRPRAHRSPSASHRDAPERGRGRARSRGTADSTACCTSRSRHRGCRDQAVVEASTNALDVVEPGLISVARSCMTTRRNRSVAENGRSRLMASGRHQHFCRRARNRRHACRALGQIFITGRHALPSVFRAAEETQSARATRSKVVGRVARREPFSERSDAPPDVQGHARSETRRRR